ncbi:YciI family protein [Rubrivirga marina]|nr:YciI family protein [Rubrivirga marina]
MIFRKADADTEAGLLPSTDLLEAMTAYNESLARAGVLLDGYGLKPSAEGARYDHDGGTSTLTGGPVAGTDALVAGITVIDAPSLDDAVAWALRWPREDGDVTLEVRQVHEPLPSFRAPRPDGRPRFVALLMHDESAAPAPDAAEQAAMARFMADAANAGVLLETGGLHATGDGARVKYTNGDPNVVPGPFPEPKVIGGYAVYQADSLDALRPWCERFGGVVGTGTSEVRPVFADADFGGALTPELQEREKALRAQSDV